MTVKLNSSKTLPKCTTKSEKAHGGMKTTPAHWPRLSDLSFREMRVVSEAIGLVHVNDDKGTDCYYDREIVAVHLSALEATKKRVSELLDKVEKAKAGRKKSSHFQTELQDAVHDIMRASRNG